MDELRKKFFQDSDDEDNYVNSNDPRGDIPIDINSDNLIDNNDNYKNDIFVDDDYIDNFKEFIKNENNKENDKFYEINNDIKKNNKLKHYLNIKVIDMINSIYNILIEFNNKSTIQKSYLNNYLNELLKLHEYKIVLIINGKIIE